MATVLSPQWMGSKSAATENEQPSLRSLALWFAVSVFVQLLLGAAVRHDHQSDAFLEGRRAVLYWHLAAHVVGALTVGYFLIRLLFRVFRNHRQDAEIIGLARKIMMLYGVQLLLGIGAAMLKIVYLLDDSAALLVSNVPAPRVWTTTAHVICGALILALSGVLLTRSYRFVVPAAVPNARANSASNASAKFSEVSA